MTTTIMHTTYSAYEIDRDRTRIRRIGGVNEPTPRQGIDGHWQDYDALRRAGDGLLIIWDLSTGKATYTSPIVATEGEPWEETR